MGRHLYQTPDQLVGLLNMSVVGNINPLGCGSYFSVFVDIENSVWVLGENYNHCLGTGNKDLVGYPIKHPYLPSNIISVACGQCHIIFLDNEGNLWGTGWNGYGQLALEGKLDRHEPEKLKVIPTITTIHARWNHTLLLDVEGSVWSCGWNSYGQLGVGHKLDDNAFIPRKLENLPKMQGICAGEHSSYFWDYNGDVWVTGEVPPQIDFGLPSSSLLKPEKIRTIQVPVQFVSTICSHCCFLDVEGNVWTCGSNDKGQLGLGENQIASKPTKVPNLPTVASVAVGDTNSFFLDVHGVLYHCGGLTGITEAAPRWIPEAIHEGTIFSALSSNSSHTLASDVDGNVWGWTTSAFRPLGNAYCDPGLPEYNFTPIPNIKVRSFNKKYPKSARK